MFREVDPNNANLPFLLEDFGNFLRDIGDYDQAQQIYSESLELLRKKRRRNSLQYGSSLFESGDYSRKERRNCKGR
ncbi:MAG: tetratricopeptide repeat protein [Blastocatellia bacterium]|nr:tetratricopeptide repeat protein [Blastocatellia bacterium]